METFGKLENHVNPGMKLAPFLHSWVPLLDVHQSPWILADKVHYSGNGGLEPFIKKHQSWLSGFNLNILEQPTTVHSKDCESADKQSGIEELHPAMQVGHVLHNLTT